MSVSALSSAFVCADNILVGLRQLRGHLLGKSCPLG